MSFAGTMGHQGFENNLEDLTFMIQQLAPNQSQSQHFCDPYSFPPCGTHQYPQLQESYAEIFFENSFLQQPHQGWHDPYVEAYIPDCWDPSYLENDSPTNQPYQQNLCLSNEVPMEQSTSPLTEPELSLEDIMQQLAANTLKFQQRVESTFQSLETQLGQLASNVHEIHELRNQGLDQLSSQPVADLIRDDQELSNPTPTTTPSNDGQQSVGKEDHCAIEVNSVNHLIVDACNELPNLPYESSAMHNHSNNFYCIDCAGGLHECATCIENNECLTLPNTGSNFEHEHPTSSIDFHMPPIEDDSFIELVVKVDDVHDLDNGSIVPSIQKPPPLESKPLLETIECTSLEAGEKIPMIIANHLQHVQEKPKKNKIGWTFDDTPMKKEMFPRKIGITVAPCQKNELVPMRIQVTWRVPTDYRKLPETTRKVHFPRPFIEPMEQLPSNSNYYFINVFSKKIQSCNTPKDKEKPTFTYSFGTYAHRRVSFSPCHAPITFHQCIHVQSFFGYAGLYMDMDQAGSPKKLPLQELEQLIMVA